MIGPIRVGLIGHGASGAYIHGPLIEAAGGYAITRVATSRPETLAARLDRPRPAARPADVFAADDVDLVVIASPNETHFRYADQALDAGKDVVIDKPFVLSSGDADHLIDKADRLGRVLTVFQNRRRDGDFALVRQVLASGVLGDIRRFEARWDRPRNVATPAPDRTPGPLWDLGSHLIDQTLVLFGSPASVDVEPIGQADGRFELTLRYGEMDCVVSADSNAQAVRPRFLVHGQRGHLSVPLYDPYDALVRSGRHPANSDFWTGAPPGRAELRTLDGARRLAIHPGCWIPYYRELRRAIARVDVPEVSASQMREVVAILEHARQRQTLHR